MAPNLANAMTSVTDGLAPKTGTESSDSAPIDISFQQPDHQTHKIHARSKVLACPASPAAEYSLFTQTVETNASEHHLLSAVI